MVDVQGKDLRVGDTIKTWWTPGRDTIIALRPYTGVYKDSLFNGEARIAEFAILNVGMTIEPQMDFTVIARQS